MKRIICLLTSALLGYASLAAEKAPFMVNVYNRDVVSLNGKWNAIVDLYDIGHQKRLYLNNVALKPEEFYEYSWEGGLRLNVPGDWNSQDPELKYYEGTVWYSRHIEGRRQPGRRQFLYFAAVSYRCNVFLNGEKICSHEGSFTPFQVEVTDMLKEEDNFLCIEVNNRRTVDAIPAMSYDWWGYGGITRDVFLVSTPEIYINEYTLKLRKGDPSRMDFTVCLSNPAECEVRLEIPELKIDTKLMTDAQGRASMSMKAPKKLVLWAPDAPKLYDVCISTAHERIREQIGFRYLSTSGTKILVNGKPVFMRSVSFHEEIPQRKGRAFSEADAQMILTEAKALGVNMVRLAHYPQNEYIVRLAERMGIILWEEIPLWQSIDFNNPVTRAKAVQMYKEMIWRDCNRCAVCFWGIANETRPGEVRNAFLAEVLETAKSMDDSRLFSIANDIATYNPESGLFEMDDPFTDKLDVIGVNKYMGWYSKWPLAPSECVWNVVPDKPLIISEFGGEALYGQNGDENWASSWSEDYQAKLFRDNLLMFQNIPNLAGVSPWVLFDFRSPYRFHPTNQDGWNRKGLVSDQGERKAAWYIMRDYYNSVKER